MKWQHVPWTWFGSYKAPVAEVVVRTADDTFHRVGRTESASTGIIGQLTVVRQISIVTSQCIEDSADSTEHNNYLTKSLLSMRSFVTSNAFVDFVQLTARRHHNCNTNPKRGELFRKVDILFVGILSGYLFNSYARAN